MITKQRRLSRVFAIITSAAPVVDSSQDTTSRIRHARVRRPVAAMLAAAVVATAGGCAADGPETDEITITWLAFTAAGEGTTGETVISRRAPEEAGDFRVEFSANEVGGIGTQSQAGAWNAAIVSTILTSAPLEGEFRFETSGWIDGPSAGALTTAGLIALDRGDEFLENVTMTGTINATGTVGPVGGIPEKIAGAADAGFEKILIPLGQRNSADADGATVDVVREGERLGVEVVEVGDIYEAYTHLTGESIDFESGARDPRLDNRSYDKLKPQVDITFNRYDDAEARLQRLPAEVQAVFVQSGVLDLIRGYHEEAVGLQQQGLQAGAYNLVNQAAAALEGIVATGELLQPIFSQGVGGIPVFFEQALDISSAERTFFAFLDQMSTFEPHTISDAEGLVRAYANVFDAYALLVFASQDLQSLSVDWANGTIGSADELFARLVTPVYWAELAEAQIAAAGVTLEVGRDNPGAELSEDVDLAQVGSFFRRGAEANFATFEEVVVADLADARGFSREAALNLLASVDSSVAAALVEANVQAAISDYIGSDKANAQYATLGYGLSNYVRNQMLVDKYYNNAELDNLLNITGVRFDAVLGRALDLGRDQLGAEIELLRAAETEPVLGVASYETAAILRRGDVNEQFSAIGVYNQAFLTARVLRYLGGLIEAD
ncbi:S16 family serine protease [Microbacterium sp. 18062]|uniref:S16 family serine protease n=1 Tax=Microbacterium sp. 18062 TaxID=2681410 RepID=UPI0013588B3A|nr:S16 family serine protease [Microbacterium sp. 18062]